MIIMGCIASKKTENRNIELNEVAKENTDKIGLTKRQRFDSKIICLFHSILHFYQGLNLF